MAEVAQPCLLAVPPDCADDGCCDAVAVHAVTASVFGGCHAVEVTCSLPSGHDGPHLTRPVVRRRLLGRMWAALRWTDS